MQKVCPITEKRIDENVARLNAFITVVFILLYIVFNFWAGMIFLLFDFTMRGFIDRQYSLIAQTNIKIVQALRLKPKLINAGPKIFAAQVGVLFTILIVLGLALNYTLFPLVLAGILGFFSFLELSFGFCVACQIYPFIRRG